MVDFNYLSLNWWVNAGFQNHQQYQPTNLPQPNAPSAIAPPFPPPISASKDIQTICYHSCGIPTGHNSSREAPSSKAAKDSTGSFKKDKADIADIADIALSHSRISAVFFPFLNGFLGMEESEVNSECL